MVHFYTALLTPPCGTLLDRRLQVSQMRNARSRLEKLGSDILVDGDQQEYERRRRFYCSLRSVSTDALYISLLATVGGFEAPSWVRAEFEKPIPPDCPPSLLREAEQYGREDDSDSEALVSAAGLGGAVQEALAKYSEWIGHTLSTPNDLSEYLKDHSDEVHLLSVKKPLLIDRTSVRREAGHNVP